MKRLTHPARARALRRRFAALGVVGIIAVPAPSATPAPPPATSSIGGPAMAERGLIFGGSSVAPPEVSAPAYVVADADTGQVLAAKDPHGLYRPASTLKTLLALTMAPRLDANGTYTADLDDSTVEGSVVVLVFHQSYPLSYYVIRLWLWSR
jgi:D-alanyl-D-alanine carboxypeptidase (penicillin-binding protein 5/6)